MVLTSLNCVSIFLVAIKVYPVGIPVLYAVILWRKRHLLNPRIHVEPDGDEEVATRTDLAGRNEILSRTLATSSKGQAKKRYCHLELQEWKKQVEARSANPSLVPSKFLWKDFGEELRVHLTLED